jgi:hypothetical protein
MRLELLGELKNPMTSSGIVGLKHDVFKVAFGPVKILFNDFKVEIFSHLDRRLHRLIVG